MNSSLSAQRENDGVVSDMPALDIKKVRQDFPILARQIHGKPLVYFDTAVSAQRPLAVIEAKKSGGNRIPSIG